MPKRVGKPGPGPPEEGTGDHSLIQGDTGWCLPPPLAGPDPVIGLSPSSQLLHSACPPPKKKQHPGNSVGSRNLQGPWVPGSQPRSGRKAENAEGRPSGRLARLQEGEGLELRAPQPARVPHEGQPEKAGLGGGTHPPVLQRCHSEDDADLQARPGTRGQFGWRQKEVQRAGPRFESLSKATHSQQAHPSFQVEPVELLRPGG